MKNDIKTSIFEGMNPEEKGYTHTHEHVQEPKVKERKTARVHLLTYPSLVKKLDDYASAHGLSRAEAFEQAVSEFLKNNA